MVKNFSCADGGGSGTFVVFFGVRQFGKTGEGEEDDTEEEQEDEGGG